MGVLELVAIFLILDIHEKSAHVGVKLRFRYVLDISIFLIRKEKSLPNVNVIFGLVFCVFPAVGRR